MAIVFIDMLGVRDKWATKGREGAENAFQRFRNLIAYSMRVVRSAEVFSGVIETDAVIVHFATTNAALLFAKTIYLNAFKQTRRNYDNRIWLRGCVIPQKSDIAWRQERNLNKPFEQIKLTLYNDDLFDAIAIEKSGIKGMRLIVDNVLVDKEVIENWLIKIDKLNFITLTTLRNSTYPDQLKGKFSDFLWMADTDEETYTELERVMAIRLRRSAGHRDEFVQAAATQVLFHECSAMMGSLRTRLHFQAQKESERKKNKSTNRQTTE